LLVRETALYIIYCQFKVRPAVNINWRTLRLVTVWNAACKR